MNEKNFCIACKSEINSGASICPVCKRYQSRWKRGFQHFATIAGVLTIITALLTYVAATWPEVRKIIYWRDRVEVVSFNSHIGIDVSNFGDGEVYLSYVTCSSENPKFTVGWSINTIAKAKSFTFKKFDRPEEKLAWGTGPLSESKWQEVLKLGRDACFDWNILDRNNPVYHDFKNFCGNDFRSIPLVANLILNSGSDGRRLIQDIPVYAVPVFKNTKECRTKLGLHD